MYYMLTLLIGKIISSDKKKIKKIFFSPFFHLFPLYKAGTILGRSFNEKYVLNSFNSNLEPRVFFKSCPFLHFYRICTLCLLTKQNIQMCSILSIKNTKKIPKFFKYCFLWTKINLYHFIIYIFFKAYWQIHQSPDEMAKGRIWNFAWRLTAG